MFHVNAIGNLDLDIIKIRVLSTDYESTSDLVGWISLAETDFTGLSRAPRPRYTLRTQGSLAAEVGATGTVTDEAGTPVYDSPSCYDDDGSATYIAQGSELRLTDRAIVLDAFGL